MLLISYYNTVIKDLIVEILEDIVIINWTPLNHAELTSYVLEYKQTNKHIFQTIIFPVSVVSIGLPGLQYDIEYVFQVYGAFTINNVEYENERSSSVTVMITMDSASSTTSTPSLIASSMIGCIGLIASSAPSSSSMIGCTGLLASVSVLSVIVVTSLVANFIFILLKISNKKPKEKERFSNNSFTKHYNYIISVFRSTLEPSNDALYETVDLYKLVDHEIINYFKTV